ncbi:MAG: tRNA (5-methylaminomethyl-2-thiouridine)(34)-methyltransferase MnmD [Flavobacteriales bacterium]|nr:tRNA (5-methylaminomethyl-2-thiouridine)(34)-methyltransferase MnmD [Flavobacteriales bacterium]
MKKEIVITSDGSSSIYIPEWQESYHSKHGAIQEAKHVFIKNGLCLLKKNNVSILEIGFGTGLNCLITAQESIENGYLIDYVGVEAFPVTEKELSALNYEEVLKDKQGLFKRIHACAWEEETEIVSNFRLTKVNLLFENIGYYDRFDLIYFDAFGFRVQPELWGEDIFKRMYQSLKKGGLLTTYAARGTITRAMQSSGFSAHKVAGPPGKREMTIARKL